VGESRTLLLLGAGGFVAGHLAAAAADAGLDLVAAGRHPGAGTLACDLLDPASIAACLDATRPSLVVNAAGAASIGRSWQRPGETFAANATGVLNLLEAVAARAPAAHVLCLSSADVYGARAGAELPLGEELPRRPITPYGAAKAAMEEICGQQARARGLRLAVVRIFNLIGPGQSPGFAAHGFARQIARAERRRQAVELALGNPGAVRDFVDAREGAGALLALSRRRSEGTFNLCSGRGTTMAELAAELARQARVEVRVSEDAALSRPADPPALVGDPARLRAEVGFAASVPLAASLGDLLDEWRQRR
jgi:GDP-4-dehydro-6-deoxy-D-mannose reductase